MTACIVHVPIEPGTTLLAVSGASGGRALRDAIESALGEPGARVIVDLSEASFLDSATLGSLTAAYTSTNGDGTARLAIVCHEDSSVRAMFAITALDGVIPIRATRQEAHAALDPR